MMKTSQILCVGLFTLGLVHGQVGLIAGVDFEGETQSQFDRTPDDLNPDDGITVSSGNAAPVFSGWTLLTLDGGNGASGS